MAVTLSQTTGNILSEYAATNISFIRFVKNEAGVITPVFQASINYDRKDYLLDAQGAKVGIVTADPAQSMPQNSPYYGTVYLSPEQFAQLFNIMGDSTKTLLEQIATLADQKIHEDLVQRGILTA